MDENRPATRGRLISSYGVRVKDGKGETFRIWYWYAGPEAEPFTSEDLAEVVEYAFGKRN